MFTRFSESMRRGWTVLTLESKELSIDVMPERGGDIAAARHRESGIDVLWSRPGFARERPALEPSRDHPSDFLSAYAGGWQSILPNGGGATRAHGAYSQMHGEAWSTEFQWSLDELGRIEMETRLARSPLHIHKRLEVVGNTLLLSETVTNEGAEAISVMWGQHPAFGGALTAEGCEIETNASIVMDGAGESTAWPRFRSEGEVHDLRTPPLAGSGVSRMAYLGGFPGSQGQLTISNRYIGLAAELTWSLAHWPYAWYWAEAGASKMAPFNGAAHVLALEPFSSWPGGMSTVMETTKTELTFGAGESKTSDLALRIFSP